MNNRDRLMQIPIIRDIMETFPGASMQVLKNMTNDEMEGMVAGGDAGGRYLESLRKFTLSELDYSEWMTFVETIIRGYELHCAKIWATDPPF